MPGWLVHPGVPDPRECPPVGAFLTDGTVLMQVLESTAAGVLCENCATMYLLRIARADIARGWTRVRPAA